MKYIVCLISNGNHKVSQVFNWFFIPKQIWGKSTYYILIISNSFCMFQKVKNIKFPTAFVCFRKAKIWNFQPRVFVSERQKTWNRGLFQKVEIIKFPTTFVCSRKSKIWNFWPCLFVTERFSCKMRDSILIFLFQISFTVTKF